VAVGWFGDSGFDERVRGVTLEPIVPTGLAATAVLLAVYEGYDTVGQCLLRRTRSKRRHHDVRNLLRLAFGSLALVAPFGVVTRDWVSVLFSLGVLGFAIAFALQRALFSLIG
jgi:small-conductance mechanosensitive channel